MVLDSQDSPLTSPTARIEGRFGGGPGPRAPLPLEVEAVVVSRGRKRVLDEFSFRFLPAESYVIMGASGAGKSTLLRFLNRLEDPDQGRILLGGQDLRSLPARELRRSMIGVVPQAARPLPGTVAENLAYPFEAAGLACPDQETMGRLLRIVELEPAWVERLAASLSGGEQQRLAIATALAFEPCWLVLDEPTAALDSRTASRVAEALWLFQKERGLGMISVCHQREHAEWLGNQAVLLEAGRVADSGMLGEVLSRHDEAAWLGTTPSSDESGEPA